MPTRLATKNFVLVSSLILTFFPSRSHAGDDLKKAGASAAQTVYLIGRDGFGQSLMTQMPAATFQANLASTFSAVQDSLAPALAAQNEVQSSAQALELRTIAVGIGINGLIGLGPIFHISINPKVRLVFTNSKNPVYPD